MAADAVAVQPLTYPEPGSHDCAVYDNPSGAWHCRFRGLYTSDGLHDDVKDWALEHGFHIINGRMVWNNNGEFDGFAPIWIDPLRHAVVVDMSAFANLYQAKKKYAEKACEFFANACTGVEERCAKLFGGLLWGWM
jgi:hypothetical protein